MTAINSLVHGAQCTVTTRSLDVINGTFLGIEVVHGERSILVARKRKTDSIPVDSVLAAGGPTNSIIGLSTPAIEASKGARHE